MREENAGKRMFLYYSKSLHSNNICLYITNTSKKEEKAMQNEFVKEICKGVISIKGQILFTWRGAGRMSGSGICLLTSVYVCFFHGIDWYCFKVVVLLIISFLSTFSFLDQHCSGAYLILPFDLFFNFLAFFFLTYNGVLASAL